MAAGGKGLGEGDSRFRVEIDDVGIADSPLRPAGRVQFGDEYVDVVTEGAFVPEGTRVRVLKINGKPRSRPRDRHDEPVGPVRRPGPTWLVSPRPGMGVEQRLTHAIAPTSNPR